ncbi:hypothetical protein CNY89_27885, partial [Amaricoccus sp. HAR-UPW-R2A-40]
RGNSTYFPDRVVPMLPESLSGDLCSLHEDVDRPCIAVRLTLTAEGHVRDHRFHRALMRSRQLHLLPRPRRPDAARIALRRPLLAARGRGPP